MIELIALLIIICLFFKLLFSPQKITAPKSQQAGSISFPPRNHVIVIGGSIGGLFAACVLSRHFQKVSIIERASLISSPSQARTSTPHSSQAHVLLMKGCTLLEKYFPGIVKEMEDAGAVPSDFMSEIAFFSYGMHPKLVKYGNMRGLDASRPFIEYHIKKRLEKMAQVEVIEKARVTDFIYSNGTVHGVKLRKKGQGVEEMYADFVVDVSGRRSDILKRLEKIKITDVPTESFDPQLIYMTCMLKKTNDIELPGEKFVYVPNPLQKPYRGIVLLRLEGGRYILTLWSLGNDKPPKDRSELYDWCLEEWRDLLQKILDSWEVVEDFHYFADDPSHFRHFERIPNWPDNLVVLGDSVATFNPRYGQGMTHLMVNATKLDEVLSAYYLDNPYSGTWKTLSKQFHKVSSAISANFWDFAQEDLAFSTTVGERTFFTPYKILLSRAMIKTCMKETKYWYKFIQVTQAIAEPTELLLDPVLMIKVFYQMFLEWKEMKKK